MEFIDLEDYPRTCKWLGSPPFICPLGHVEREQPYLGDEQTMVIYHLGPLGWSSKYAPYCQDFHGVQYDWSGRASGDFSFSPRLQGGPKNQF